MILQGKTKLLKMITGSLLLGSLLVAQPSFAYDYHRHHHNRNAVIAAGALFGFAAGATANAMNGPRYYDSGYGYYDYPYGCRKVIEDRRSCYRDRYGDRVCRFNHIVRQVCD